MLYSGAISAQTVRAQSRGAGVARVPNVARRQSCNTFVPAKEGALHPHVLRYPVYGTSAVYSSSAVSSPVYPVITTPYPEAAVPTFPVVPVPSTTETAARNPVPIDATADLQRDPGPEYTAAPELAPPALQGSWLSPRDSHSARSDRSQGPQPVGPAPTPVRTAALQPVPQAMAPKSYPVGERARAPAGATAPAPAPVDAATVPLAVPEPAPERRPAPPGPAPARAGSLHCPTVDAAAVPLAVPVPTVDAAAVPLAVPLPTVDAAAVPLAVPVPTVDAAAVPLAVPLPTVDAGAVPLAVPRPAPALSFCAECGKLVARAKPEHHVLLRLRHAAGGALLCALRLGQQVRAGRGRLAGEGPPLPRARPGLAADQRQRLHR